MTRAQAVRRAAAAALVVAGMALAAHRADALPRRAEAYGKSGWDVCAIRTSTSARLASGAALRREGAAASAVRADKLALFDWALRRLALRRTF